MGEEGEEKQRQGPWGLQSQKYLLLGSLHQKVADFPSKKLHVFYPLKKIVFCASVLEESSFSYSRSITKRY